VHTAQTLGHYKNRSTGQHAKTRSKSGGRWESLNFAKSDAAGHVFGGVKVVSTHKPGAGSRFCPVGVLQENPNDSFKAILLFKRRSFPMTYMIGNNGFMAEAFEILGFSEEQVGGFLRQFPDGDRATLSHKHLCRFCNPGR